MEIFIAPFVYCANTVLQTEDHDLSMSWAHFVKQSKFSFTKCLSLLKVDR